MEDTNLFGSPHLVISVLTRVNKSKAKSVPKMNFKLPEVSNWSKHFKMGKVIRSIFWYCLKRLRNICPNSVNSALFILCNSSNKLRLDCLTNRSVTPPTLTISPKKFFSLNDRHFLQFMNQNLKCCLKTRSKSMYKRGTNLTKLLSCKISVSEV